MAQLPQQVLQAIQVLQNATGKVSATKAGHAEIDAALQIVYAEIADKYPDPAEQETTEKPELVEA